jgi:hypothetical protein
VTIVVAVASTTTWRASAVEVVSQTSVLVIDRQTSAASDGQLLVLLGEIWGGRWTVTANVYVIWTDVENTTL